MVIDSNFPRAAMAARVGLHGAFSFPIRKGDRVYGTMEFFSREIREPDQSLLDMVADLGIKVGQFVDFRQTENALRQAEALAEVARVLGDIGHDIRNMLMPIVTGAGLLEQEIDECYGHLPESLAYGMKPSRDLAKELTGMIRTGSRHIQNLV